MDKIFIMSLLIMHHAESHSFSSSDYAMLEQEVMEDLREPILQLLNYYHEKTLREYQHVDDVCTKTRQSQKEVYDRLYERIQELSSALMKMPVKQCLPGWQRYGNKCYKTEETLANYTNAMDHCKSYGAELATPLNEDENTFIAGLTDEENWIGVVAGLQGHYVYTYYVQNITYSKWYQGEPNKYGIQNCVQINYKQTSYWDNNECWLKKKYSCQQSL